MKHNSFGTQFTNSVTVRTSPIFRPPSRLFLNVCTLHFCCGVLYNLAVKNYRVFFFFFFKRISILNVDVVIHFPYVGSVRGWEGQNLILMWDKSAIKGRGGAKDLFISRSWCSILILPLRQNEDLTVRLDIPARVNSWTVLIVQIHLQQIWLRLLLGRESSVSVDEVVDGSDSADSSATDLTWGCCLGESRRCRWMKLWMVSISADSSATDLTEVVAWERVVGVSGWSCGWFRLVQIHLQQIWLRSLLGRESSLSVSPFTEFCETCPF